MPATLDPSSLCRQPPGLYAGLAVAKSARVSPSGGTRALRSRLAPPGDEPAVKGSRLKRAPTTIWLVP